jgi:uncharacterized membrane protein YbhN (UPF0104 family)
LTGSHLRARITVRRVVGLAVACAILFFMARAVGSGLGDLGAYKFSISPWRIAGAFAVFAVLFPVYAAVWQNLLSRFGYRLPYSTSLRVWLLSQAGRYVPGKVWFAIGRIYLCEREGVPKRITTLATGLELAMVLGSSLVVFGVTAGIKGSLSGHPYAWSLLLVPVIMGCLHPRLVAAVLSRLGRGHGELTMKYGDVLKMLGVYAICWCVYGVGFYLIATAVTVTGGSAPGAVFGPALIPDMIGVNALSWTAGFLSMITPAGLGVREGVAFSLLSKILARPYPSLIPLVARVWVTLAELAAIGLALLLKGRR